MEAPETSPTRKTPKRHTYNPKAVKPGKAAKGPLKLVSTIVSSALAVLIILFAMGKLPQVDAFWDGVNKGIQSHNDQVVIFFIRNGPLLLIAVGIIGCILLFKPARKQKSS